MSGFGAAPFGAAPFGAEGGGIVSVVDGLGFAHPLLANTTGLRALTDSTGVVRVVDGQAITAMLDSLGTGDVSAGDIIMALLERLALTGTPLPSSARYAAATDGLRYAEALALGWEIALTEGVQFAGSAQGDLVKLAAIVDTLHAIGAVANRVDAMAVVATVLGINGMIATGWQLDAVETVAFQDGLAGSLAAIGKLVDSAGFADTPAPALRLTAVMADTLAAADAAGASLQAFAALAEEVLFYATLRLGDAEYAGWVLNGGAASEYRNYPFNGFIAFEGTYYGTSDTGLFELVGSTDHGTPIDAWIKTALMDFGTGKKKRIPDVYVAFAGDGTLQLKVITTGPRGEQTEHWYTAELGPDSTGLRNGRFKVGRGLQSVYWQFAVCNVAGGAIELDKLELRPLVLDRRV